MLLPGHEMLGDLVRTIVVAAVVEATTVATDLIDYGKVWKFSPFDRETKSGVHRLLNPCDHEHTSADLPMYGVYHRLEA